MAHEIYHQMQPFGQVPDTLFEEFSAYYLSIHISQSQWARFEGYDGLEATSLTQWFTDHRLMYAYENLSLYPEKVMPMVKQVTPISTADMIASDQVITFNDSSVLSILETGRKCLVIDATGQEVCAPSK
jgi:hypothetical protein